MRAISINQPWAWAIAAGVKRVENRTWTTSYRGPLLIHASLTYHEENWERVELAAPEIVVPDELDCGGIVGVCDLVDVVTSKPGDPFFCGPYGFVLANARPIEWIEVRGKLGLWRPPAEIVAQIHL